MTHKENYNTGCDISVSHVNIECDCNYVPPKQETLLIRKSKKGKYEVKINGKGKWINAEYNEETKTISYTA